MKESFTCPITGKLIKDPMSTPYGHMYERTEIEKWVRVTGECPITKQRLQMEDLMPQPDVKQAIDNLRRMLGEEIPLQKQAHTVQPTSNKQPMGQSGKQ